MYPISTMTILWIRCPQKEHISTFIQSLQCPSPNIINNEPTDEQNKKALKKLIYKHHLTFSLVFRKTITFNTLRMKSGIRNIFNKCVIYQALINNENKKVAINTLTDAQVFPIVYSYPSTFDLLRDHFQREF